MLPAVYAPSQLPLNPSLTVQQQQLVKGWQTEQTGGAEPALLLSWRLRLALPPAPSIAGPATSCRLPLLEQQNTAGCSAISMTVSFVLQQVTLSNCETKLSTTGRK